MNQLRLVRTLLTPSILSGYASVMLALVALGISGWAYISREQLFYDYLFGPFGAVTVLLRAPDFFAVFRITILNNPLTYDAIILVCAILIGLLVYTLLEGLGRVARETSVVWYEFHTHTPEAMTAMTETLIRLAVRCISFMCWVLYVIFFINILVPFCILLLQMGIDTLSKSVPVGVVACLLAALYLAVSLHLHVILIRLYFLRPRLFGWMLQG